MQAEFNRQINKASAVIFIIGDKTKNRLAGNSCKRIDDGEGCDCTPYKQNTNRTETCKIEGKTHKPAADEDLGKINAFSYIEHEFKQAVRKNKPIIIVYNSLNKQSSWLPSYMSDYENDTHPFWKRNAYGDKIGDYQYIKAALGYE